MTKKIFTFLNNSYSTSPRDVDRLIISAYLAFNNIKLVKNEFLKTFIIPESNFQEFNLLSKFITLLKNDSDKFEVENLIELFEFVISPSDRIINGAVYTPQFIREYIVKQSFFEKKEDIQNCKIADISCGCGGFLYNAAKEIKKRTNKTYFNIFKNQIFGLDIQNYSIDRAKLLLCILAISEGEDRKQFDFNLFVADALSFKWNDALNKFPGFDIILGNPPYVCSRNLTKETKDRLSKWEVCNSGHPDLYIPFFQIGIESLASKGILGFITMNSFFKSLNGRSLREYFKKNSLDFRIIDFGVEQIFKSRYTYTCVCFIVNQQKDSIAYIKPESSQTLPKSIKSFKTIAYKNLDSHKGWNLHNHETISKIESTGVSLGQLYKTRNGIATLKNEIYIFNPIQEDNTYYYLQNGSVFQIEKAICRDILNSNKLNSSISFNKLKEKVIFPYDNSHKPKLLEENYIKRQFPKAYEYLEAKKKILSERDNGQGEYEKWFAFGRSQSLEKMRHKLFFPHLASKTPNFLIDSDENLLFYNGLALLGQTRNELIVIKKIMESKIFWFYIQNTSKPYASGYFSFSSNYIRNFGICDLDKNEMDFVLKEKDKKILDKFFEKKYEVEV